MMNIVPWIYDPALELGTIWTTRHRWLATNGILTVPVISGTDLSQPTNS
jgi:hypothetical protein